MPPAMTPGVAPRGERSDRRCGSVNGSSIVAPMASPDSTSTGEQAALTDFSDSESTAASTPESEPDDVDQLAERVDRLEELFRQNSENVEELLGVVERVTDQLGDPSAATGSSNSTSESEHHATETKTDLHTRGYQ